jgi:hypothetical protein
LRSSKKGSKSLLLTLRTFLITPLRYPTPFLTLLTAISYNKKDVYQQPFFGTESVTKENCLFSSFTSSSCQTLSLSSMDLPLALSVSIFFYTEKCFNMLLQCILFSPFANKSCIYLHFFLFLHSHLQPHISPRLTHLPQSAPLLPAHTFRSRTRI